MSQDLVIKTTARLQEASEPERHKPIMRIEARNGRTTLSHISDANGLANTIRVSIDSGRDNPFRPDGEIYRMTDPIVDFYKLGPNRSGCQTPTYANLRQPAAATSGHKASGDKKSNTSRLWKRRAQPSHEQQHQNPQEALDASQTETRSRKSSCWRKWFCCCCYCLCNDHNSKRASKTDENRRLNENIDLYNSATAGQGPKSQDLIIGNSKSSSKTGHRRADYDELDESKNWDSNSPAAAATGTRGDETPPATSTAPKQTRVVIVEKLASEPAQNIAEREPNELSTNCNTMTNRTTSNGTSRRLADDSEARDKNKTALRSTSNSSSKCVVS